MEKTIEIPDGYEARIEGNKVILERKESDDERIRQAIESIIRVYGKTQGEWLAGYDMDTLVVHLRDAFACLEKQKERGPLSKDEEYTLARIIEYLEDNDCPSEWKDLLHDVYSLPYQKEHQPAGWKQENCKDLSEFECAMLHIGESFFGKNAGLNPNDTALVKEQAKLIIDLIESKPAEWSEEDEKVLMGIIERGSSQIPSHEPALRGDQMEWLMNRLKFLRPQPQQNMSIGFMLYLDEHRPDGKMCLSNAECNQLEIAFKNQDWDTILKYAEKYLPNWKPSEEQMWALDVALENFYHSDDKAALESLRTDLQKLL